MRFIIFLFINFYVCLFAFSQNFPGTTGALTDNNCSGSFDVFTANVSGVNPTDVIESLTVNISHTWVSEVQLFLYGPNGQILELSTGNGSGFDNYTNTIFTDNATQYITVGVPPFSSSFKPEGRYNNDDLCNPPGTLGTYSFESQFWGNQPNGIWTLKIKDGGPGDIGVLNSWSVTIGPAPALENVGINTLNPQATLDVNGKLRVGDDSSPNIAGMIRYNSNNNDFEGYNGTFWNSFIFNYLELSRINDFDNNTSVDVQTNFNENIIRFTLDGTERFTMFPTRLNINTGSNTFIGGSSGLNNTSGNFNTSLGVVSLYSNTTGSFNTALGNSSLQFNTTGSNNTATGAAALSFNTSGISNTAVGTNSLFSNTSGSGNIAFGKEAGRYIANETANQTSNNSIYLGYDTRASQNGNTNEVVIGYEAIGNGSNTVTLGNNAIAQTYLRGEVNLSPIGTNAGETGQLKLRELAVNGTNAILLRSPDNLTSDVVLTLPSSTGINGQVLSTNGSGLLNWTSAGGGSGTGLSHPTTGSTFESETNNPSMTGINNTAIGVNALMANTTGVSNSGFGYEALSSNTTAHVNSAFGNSALKNNTTGGENSAFGAHSLGFNTIGNYNSAFGRSSLLNNVSGGSNSAFGWDALYGNTSGHLNSAFGVQALLNNSIGENNSAFGVAALLYNTTGSNNIAIGYNAGRHIANGTNNQTSSNSIYLGVDAKASSNGNTNEIVIGNGTVGSGSNTVTIGNSSTILTNIKGAVTYSPIGTNSGQTGQIKFQELTANGTNTVTLRSPDVLAGDIELTLPSNAGTNGQVLSTNGSGVLSWATSGGGSGNGLVHPTTGSTFESGTNYTSMSGNNNTAIGVNAGDIITSGADNTLVGVNAGSNIYEGIDNVAIGSGAMSNASYVDANVAVGKNALYYDKTGFNVAVGYEALYKNGYQDINQISVANTAVGNGALRENNLGNFNTAVGNFALYYNTGGYENTAIGSNALWLNTSGDHNTALGVSALHSNSTGNRNTAIGFESLSQFIPSYSSSEQDNTALGWQSGYNLDLHSRNTFLGSNASSTILSGITNTTAIGYGSRTTSNNQVRIGNSSVTSIGGYAGWTNISDGRVKKNVLENVHGLDFILKLRPVTYQLMVHDISKVLEEDNLKGVKDSDVLNSIIEKNIENRSIKEEVKYTGFIAQEVEMIANQLGFDFSAIDKPNNDNGLWGLRYGEFVVPLVKAVQEQQVMIENLKTEIDLLKEQNKLMFEMYNKSFNKNNTTSGKVGKK
ncbi:MAG: proprotein convertase P-domain-containing protein [Saprospiraceae bacterium]